MKDRTGVAGIAGAIVVVLLAGAGAAAAGDVTEVRYGTVEARRPTELSSGLLGIRKSAGMAYTVSLTEPAGGTRLEVTSANTAFLPGDCVAVDGQGKKAKLARAQPKLCGAEAAAQASAFVAPPHPGLTGGQGADPDACAQARAEARSWPVGAGRHRALLRELLMCGSGHGAAPSAAELEPDCAAAWKEVESLPFGPARAEARRHAHSACGWME